jgi:hypothetical protein
VTGSPIELSWTAKKENQIILYDIFIQVELVENDEKVKVPLLSFKHFALPEANSRTMLCNTSFSRVSLSIIPIEIPFGSWDTKGSLNSFGLLKSILQFEMTFRLLKA